MTDDVSDTLTVRVYANAYATSPEWHEITWARFVNNVIDAVETCEAKDKRLLPALSTVITTDPDAPRCNAGVIALGALVLDVDRLPDNDTAESFVERVDSLGADALVYATPSDKPEARRLRVVLRLSRPANVSEVDSLRYAVAEALHLAPGMGVETARAHSQLFFVGRLHGTPPREVWVIDGAPETRGLDVGAWASCKLEHKWPKARAALPTPSRGESSGVADVEPDATPRVLATVEALLPVWTTPGEITPGGGRRPVLRALGGWLARLGWSDAEVIALVHHLPTARGPEVATRLALECARQCRDTDGEVAAGYDSLRAWLSSAGEIDALDKVEQAARDPRMPEGFQGVWSEWWARVYARAYRWCTRETSVNAHAHPSGQSPAANGSTNATNNDLLLPDTDKHGTPLGTARNVYALLKHMFGEALAWDNGYGVVMIREDFTHFQPLLTPGRLRDGVDTAMLFLCEQAGIRVSASLVYSVIVALAKENAYWPLQEYAAALPAWDGKPRINTAFSDFWGAEDTPANRACARVFFLGAAYRMLEPGADVHTALYLQGGEGVGKSRSLKALAPIVGGVRCYSDAPLDLDSKDAPAALRGISIYEVAENRSFSKHDQDQIKHFLSIACDDYRPPYERNRVQVPRTACFAITTNSLAFLAGDAKNRRALPVHVGAAVDVDGITDAREQFWAEAVARVQAGERPWITPEEDAHLTIARGDVADEGEDPWHDTIAAYLKKSPEPIAITDIATDVLLMTVEKVDRRAQARIAEVLRKLGWGRKHTRFGKRWAPPPPEGGGDVVELDPAKKSFEV